MKSNTLLQPKKAGGQSFVEFALIIPFFLLLLTGILEFSYAVYTWAAVSEVARIGTRYAVTGQYDTQYCAAAAAALGGTYAADDLADSVADCVVPTSVTDNEVKSSALQDWARLPSIHDAALKGGGAGMLFDPNISGNYLNFLGSTYTTFHQDFRGNPTANGYIDIGICSNRSGVQIDPNSYYYLSTPASPNRFNGVCFVNGKYSNDAGGPGDRIRVTVTYNHPLIVPFFNALWPNLKMTTTQDAIVEKFRTSRVTGLTSGISSLPTWTLTPAPTNTEAPTNTPMPATATETATITLTPTSTPLPCTLPNGGNGLRGEYYGKHGTTTNETNRFTTLIGTRIDSTVNFNWGGGEPMAGVGSDQFEVRWTGQVYPPFPGDYNFLLTGDDGIRLFIDGVVVLDGWTDQPATLYTSIVVNLTCAKHDIQIDYYENGGNASIVLGWQNGNFGTMDVILQKYLFAPTTPVQPTSTITNTPTNTRTATVTLTKKPTNTKAPTKTFTKTVYKSPTTYKSPTKTNTSAPIPTNTPVTPTVTLNVTRTYTPQTPTCATPSDLGGCP